MFFWLKKLIGFWITPLPVSALLVLAGLVLLWRGRHARLGRWLIVAGTMWLALWSNKFVSQRAIRSLETQYTAIPELMAGQLPPQVGQVRYVVVLGGGNGFTPGVAALNLLSTSARARLSEAVRLMHALPDAKLLVSGPKGRKHASHATVLERAAISLGVPRERIQRIEHARDTEDEAQAVKDVAGDAPVALVTSAWHMPRSAALFRTAGVNFVACPTDYLSHDDGEWHWRDLLCDVDSLERSSLATREWIGRAWITLRGKWG